MTTAVLCNNTAALEAYLGAGASVHACDKQGHSALFLAVALGQSNAVRVLLEHGANPNIAVSPDGGAPLQLAVHLWAAERMRLEVSHGLDHTSSRMAPASEPTGMDLLDGQGEVPFPVGGFEALSDGDPPDEPLRHKVPFATPRPPSNMAAGISADKLSAIPLSSGSASGASDTSSAAECETQPSIVSESSAPSSPTSKEDHVRDLTQPINGSTCSIGPLVKPGAEAGRGKCTAAPTPGCSCLLDKLPIVLDMSSTTRGSKQSLRSHKSSEASAEIDGGGSCTPARHIFRQQEAITALAEEEGASSALQSPRHGNAVSMSLLLPPELIDSGLSSECDPTGTGQDGTVPLFLHRRPSDGTQEEATPTKPRSRNCKRPEAAGKGARERVHCALGKVADKMSGIRGRLGLLCRSRGDRVKGEPLVDAASDGDVRDAGSGWQPLLNCCDAPTRNSSERGGCLGYCFGVLFTLFWCAVPLSPDTTAFEPCIT
jgi:hypothetical protein